MERKYAYEIIFYMEKYFVCVHVSFEGKICKQEKRQGLTLFKTPNVTLLLIFCLRKNIENQISFSFFLSFSLIM